jgi:hypothetical protein
MGCGRAAPSSSRADLDADEARAIAKEAYVFTYPLVMMYRTMYLQAIDVDSDSYAGGFGEWLHLGMSTPQDTDIVTPNNDTPYSYAWVDTRAEPWVLTLSEIAEDRFYTSQWDDLWGYVLDNPGSVNDGNGGVSVLLASPTWAGDLPGGVDRIIRGDTDFLGTLTRTQVLDNDLAAVDRIQSQYQLQPLSAFLGTAAPAAAPAIDWKPWEEGVERTDGFWDFVNFLLPLTTANPEDQPVLDRMARIGLVSGELWNPDSLDPEVREAIAAGMQDALADLDEAANNIVDPSLYFRTREDLGGDYFNRAVGILVGIFGNWKSVSVYYAILADAEGNPLDGSQHGYQLTLPGDQMPPVEYFWSFTMYNLPQRHLVDNPIDRYSIGSATPGLERADDGSLTIYLTHGSPGPDMESNWLPVPDGPWGLTLRTYGPGDSILNGTYQVPDIRRVN